MSEISLEDMTLAFQEIEKFDSLLLPRQFSPYTVCLVDEEVPDGPVGFVGTDGITRLIMPQADYWAIAAPL